MRLTDIAWLAGVLEGEASFGYYRGSPTIQVQMTDADVIQRITRLMSGRPRAPWFRKDGYKPVYSCVVHGSVAVAWMLTLYSFLGMRRRAKIRESIASWHASSRKPRAGKGERFPATCHPDRNRCALGLCKECYMRDWHQRTGRNGTYYRRRKAAA